MSGWLLDTNILSELRKGVRADSGLREWFATVEEGETFLSVLSLAEIRHGIERLRPRDPSQVAILEPWLFATRRRFADRVLLVDEAVADAWGRMRRGQPVSPMDGLLAATAIVHGITIVTRNVRDFRGCDVAVLNPFSR